jgi:hypothetical protein
MAGWLQTTSHSNLYVVDVLRTLMLAGSTAASGFTQDYAVILLTMAVLVLIDARGYSRLGT